MPKCACLQMVEQLHLGNDWQPHQAVLVPMVHFPPICHAAISLCRLHVCCQTAELIFTRACPRHSLPLIPPCPSPCPCLSTLGRFSVHVWI